MNVKNLIGSIAAAVFLGMGFTAGLSINFRANASSINHDFCIQKGLLSYAEAETPRYYIYICVVRPDGLVYFSQRKDRGSSEVIGPIVGRVTYINNRLHWIFRSGNYSYIVTERDLAVTKNQRVILKDKMLFFDRVNE